MKKSRFPTLLELAILLYCLWESRNMLESWYNTPHLKYADWAFLIWSMPLIVYWAYPFDLKSEKQTTFFLFPLALIITLLGSLGNLRALGHLGLALALTGFFPWNPLNLLWTIASVAWMPATGYFLKLLSINVIILFRFFIAFLGMLVGMILIFKKSKNLLT